MVVIFSEVAAGQCSLITKLSGLLTPIIAVIVAEISRQQYLLNKRQYRLALFEKRFAVFSATKKFIRAVMGGKVYLDMLLEFNVETVQDEFLFEKDIEDYLEELRKTANGIHLLREKGREQGVGFASEDRKKLSEMEIRFKDQADTLRDKFRKYFDFRKP